MPLVTVYKKLYVTAGRQRQPRNASSVVVLETNGPHSISDPTYPQTADSPIGYVLPGNATPGVAILMFWNVTDGVTGQVYPAGDINVPLGVNNLTITAWYLPISGPASISGNTAIIDDAFSSVLNNFINDTFVMVTPDDAAGSLTLQANVFGIVPTAKAEKLQAAQNVASTAEPFDHWFTADAGSPTSPQSRDLNVPAGANGVAIAIYQYPVGAVQVQVRPPREVGWNGVMVMGGQGGTTVFIGSHGVIVWPGGPDTYRPVADTVIGLAAQSMDKRAGVQVRWLAAQDALSAVKQTIKEIESEAKANKVPLQRGARGTGSRG